MWNLPNKNISIPKYFRVFLAILFLKLTLVAKLYEVLVDSGFSSILFTATRVGIHGR